MISKVELKTMFKNISKDTSWDMKGKMLWGYFFFDISEEKLKKASKKLQKLDYKVVGIFQTDDQTSYVLHIEKEEIHSVDSLFNRNKELYKFAEDNSIECYDGMDVGPIIKKKK